MGLLSILYVKEFRILEFGRERFMCLHLEGLRESFHFLVHSVKRFSSFWRTSYLMEL